MSANVSKTYTDADVQTARRIHLSSMATSSGAMREALDAVLPGIVSRAVNRAKAEALREAANAYGPAQISGLFTSPTHYTQAWLLRRADDLERGVS